MAKPKFIVDFDEIAKVINSSFEVHKTKMRECCVKSNIIPLSDYYEALQKEFKDIESSTTPSKTRPDPLEYMDLFKAFDEYPSNLQKPKRHPIKEHTSRMNGTLKAAKQNSSSSSVNSSKVLEDQPSAASIYNDFCRYTQKLNEFKEELRKQTLSKEYAEKLDSINIFARELDKLLLSSDDGVEAFTKEEEDKMKKISEYMEHFAYIQENHDLYSTTADGSEGSSPRLNDLVDIITDALVAVNCYKSC